MDHKYQVSKNILYNFLGQAILLLLGILTTPYIIHSLGNSLYGIFSVILATVSYFSILDFGLGTSVVKYISEYNAKSDRQILGKIITTALTAYIFLGLIGALLIFLLTPILVGKFLQIPNALIPTAMMVFYISAVGFLINMVLTVFNSVPNALQRMDITNSRNIIFSLLSYLGIVVILFLGGGLIQITIWNIFVSLLATIFFLKIIIQLLGGIQIRLSFDKEIFLKLINFGVLKFLGNISGQIVFQLDKIIIGIFHPIALVTYYTVPVMLIQRAFIMMLNIPNAVFPALVRAHSLKNYERTKQLYLRMTKFITLIMFPIMATIFIFSNSILSLWMGADFAQRSANTLRILAIAYFIASMSAPGVIVADAFGKPKIPALFALLSATINLVAALILIPNFGIEGAAWAIFINFAAQVPIFIVVVNKYIVKVSNVEVFTKSLIKPIAAGIISSLIVIFIPKLTQNLILNFSFGMMVFIACYVLAIFLFATFDNKDKLAIYYLSNAVMGVFKTK